MRHARRTVISILVGAGLALSGTLAVAGDLTAQASTRIQVLVAPLKAGPGVNSRFGERVAREVAKSLENITGMEAMPEGDVKDALKQFQLDPQEMTPIEWRQLGGRLGAQLVMFGAADPTGGGVEVRATFLDPGSGDELPVEPFTVANDGQHRQAAERIAAGLESQVAYQRSVIFCQEYLGSSQLEDALRNCNQALEVNPASARALYLRGRVHMELGDHEAAVEDLETVVAGNEANTDALQSLAYSHAQLGNRDRSLELYMQYLEFQPDDPQVRLNVAFELAKAGAHAEATEVLREGVERDSTNAALWEYLGQVALAAGTAATGGPDGPTVKDTALVRLAVRSFDKVLELKGDSVGAGVLTNAMAAHLELGDLDEALAFSESALTALRAGGTAPATAGGGETAPEAPEGVAGAEASREELRARIHSLRADIFARQESFDRAAAELNRALEIDPDYPNAYARRGSYKLRAGDTQGALADYRKAVSEQGQDPDAIANQLFGTGYNNYHQRDRYSTAIDMYRTALEFAEQPQTREQINFFTAYAYFQLGTSIDSRNEGQEACQPARQALSAFQNVGPYLGRAGSVQSGSQAQIREALDVQLYRQQQIIRAKCG